MAGARVGHRWCHCFGRTPAPALGRRVAIGSRVRLHRGLHRARAPRPRAVASSRDHHHRVRHRRRDADRRRVGLQRRPAPIAAMGLAGRIHHQRCHRVRGPSGDHFGGGRGHRELHRRGPQLGRGPWGVSASSKTASYVLAATVAGYVTRRLRCTEQQLSVAKARE